MLSAEEEKEAKEIALKIAEAMDGVIICPRCKKNGGITADQTLTRYGDWPDMLFCPHCELDLKIEINSLG